jgi:hypothetical protein
MSTSYSIHHSQTWLRLLFIAGTSLVLVSSLYYNLQFYEAREQIPKLIPPTDPQIHQSLAPQLQVGMHIRDFTEFNMLQGKFAANVIVWFRGTKLPSYQELEKFTFEKVEIKLRSEPITRTIEEEKVVEYEMLVNFSLPLNFRDFPLDDHRLLFILSNSTLSSHQFVTTSNSSFFTIHHDSDTQGWRLINKGIEVGYTHHPLEDQPDKKLYPKIVFFLEFERSGTRAAVSIFLPLIIIFFVTIFSFSLDPDDENYYNVISMSTGSIFGLIAYRFVIETISPVTSYFTLSDYLFLFFLVAIMFIFIINLFGSTFNQRQKSLIALILNGLTILFFLWLFVTHGL